MEQKLDINKLSDSDKQELGQMIAAEGHKSTIQSSKFTPEHHLNYVLRLRPISEIDIYIYIYIYLFICNWLLGIC